MGNLNKHQNIHSSFMQLHDCELFKPYLVCVAYDRWYYIEKQIGLCDECDFYSNGCEKICHDEYNLIRLKIICEVDEEILTLDSDELSIKINDNLYSIDEFGEYLKSISNEI